MTQPPTFLPLKMESAKRECSTICVCSTVPECKTNQFHQPFNRLRVPTDKDTIATLKKIYLEYVLKRFP